MYAKFLLVIGAILAPLVAAAPTGGSGMWHSYILLQYQLVTLTSLFTC
ncbi:hypothetical protein ANO14919_074500 [Xylariales sp. No.14919]|nr:hypothetical protein ANO14919_074500 [Xylariales sp. No.14919]